MQIFSIKKEHLLGCSFVYVPGNEVSHIKICGSITAIYLLVYLSSSLDTHQTVTKPLPNPHTFQDTVFDIVNPNTLLHKQKVNAIKFSNIHQN